MLVPQYFYPEGPSLLMGLNGDNKPIGRMWRESVHGTPAYLAHEIYYFTADFNRYNNISPETATFKVLHIFPNGIQFGIKTYCTNWFSPDQSREIVMSPVLKYGDHEYTQQEATQMGLGQLLTWDPPVTSRLALTSEYQYGGSEDMLHVHGIWFPVTQYYNQDPVENVTEPYALQFFFAFATNSLFLDLRTVFLIDISDNFWDITDRTPGINPGGVIELMEHNVNALSSPYTSILDLTAMNNGMKGKGNGSTDDSIRTNPNPPTGDDDTSTPGGGDGNYDDKSDPIDFPELPTGGALTSGMIKGFVIGSAALAALQNRLWDISIFDIATQFQKLVNEPMQCFISLHAMPVLPTTNPTAEHIKLGGYDTEVSANKITNQYVIVNCGTLDISKYWGSALDYAPYTRIEIFLPFIGLKSLQIEDCMGAKLQLKYYIDCLTGACTAFIKCGQSVLYTYTGNCLQHIPVTGQSSDLLHANISAIGMTAVGVATGNPAAAVSGAAAGAINSATAKNHVQRSGDLAGSAGIMGDYTPYVIIHRPVQSLAKGYNNYKGYPSNITAVLGTLSGYTEIEHIHIAAAGATDTELQEIEKLLKAGVII